MTFHLAILTVIRKKVSERLQVIDKLFFLFSSLKGEEILFRLIYSMWT